MAVHLRVKEIAKKRRVSARENSTGKPMYFTGRLNQGVTPLNAFAHLDRDTFICYAALALEARFLIQSRYLRFGRNMSKEPKRSH
jgi:hypothetical protein